MVIPTECRPGTSLVPSEAFKAKIRKLVGGSPINDFFSSLLYDQVNVVKNHFDILTNKANFLKIIIILTRSQ